MMVNHKLHEISDYLLAITMSEEAQVTACQAYVHTYEPGLKCCDPMATSVLLGGI